MKRILLAMFCAQCLCAQSPEDVARAIRDEAVRPNRSPEGRPLPLAGHWNMGSNAGGFDPKYQLRRIESGDHLLPWFALPELGAAVNAEGRAYYEAAIRRAAELRLPIALVSTQWEMSLYFEQRYAKRPPARNAGVILADGTIEKRLDPFGPIEPWKEIGKEWGSSPMLRQLQEWYPNPPLVLFVSNNEASKLTWHNIELSTRYLKIHGRGRPDAFKQEAVGQAWIPRYRAMQDGIRQALPNETWRRNAIFIGYDAFGPPHFARWDGWTEYATPLRDAIDPAALAWDGGSPSFYMHNWNASTDSAVWSPQGEAMNWVFMLQETLRLNPKFWFELSTWDGEEEKRKKLAGPAPYTPERYGAMVEYGMWLLRPRTVREFRNSGDTAANAGRWFDAVVAGVNRVHRSETLQRFWRQGELVPNRARQHPYQAAVPVRYAKEDRWFALDTTADPATPFRLDTRLPVWSLALALGQAPQREWLVYAFGPMGDRKDVGITIPGYRRVTVDVPVSGAFYWIREGSAEGPRAVR